MEKIKSTSFICILTLVITIITFSCNNNTQKQPEQDSLPEEKNRVSIVIVEREDFTREVISNGKLTALQKAELYFRSDEIIKSINVKNGQLVSAGTVLAMLNDADLQFDVKGAEYTLEEAELERKDDLLSMGYRDERMDKIPEEHFRIANIKSGYNNAKLSLEEATRILESATLKAPFSGKVAGIVQRTYEKADLSHPFCTLINDKQFTIEFPLLETELGEAEVNQRVTATLVAGAKQMMGKITEINPQIDENGLIWIKAEITNPGGYMEGMNVKVSVKKAIPNQMVVPKQSVVLRQNREVLFRYTHGIAYWTYVNVLDENETEYSVEAVEGASLQPGDTVIISNNLNLAHESEVEID